MTLRHTLPLAVVGLLLAGPAQAQWRGDSIGRDDWGARDHRVETTRPSGRVTVTRLRSAEAAGVLAHGGIVIGAGDPTETGLSDGLPIYEAAVASQLARAGYDTQGAAPSAAPGAGGQVAEIALSHAEVRPAEQRHKRVSGAAETYVSNRGSGFGLALNLDFRKPKGPVISTRLDVRIRDRATNAVLWEGHAETAAYETAEGLGNGKTAARLSEALFAGFPNSATVVGAQ